MGRRGGCDRVGERVISRGRRRQGRLSLADPGQIIILAGGRRGRLVIYRPRIHRARFLLSFRVELNGSALDGYRFGGGGDLHFGGMIARALLLRERRRRGRRGNLILRSVLLPLICHPRTVRECPSHSPSRTATNSALTQDIRRWRFRTTYTRGVVDSCIFGFDRID